jgi:hypothetical protein
VISVDTKAKEWLGNRDRPGRTWRPGKDPIRVDCHTFTTNDQPVVIPYGIYDIARNTGWVIGGTDHDTAEFAVESIRRWWRHRGRADHPDATRLLITADCGGSNDPRRWTWKKHLAVFALESGLEITVCHLPPGTSKWNKIEHRMFCHITANRRGRPLTSYKVVIETIAATTTRTGLRIGAELRARDAMVAVPLAWIAAVVVIDVLAPPDIHLGLLLVAAPAITIALGGPWLIGLVTVLAVTAQVIVAVLRDRDELGVGRALYGPSALGVPDEADLSQPDWSARAKQPRRGAGREQAPP